MEFSSRHVRDERLCRVTEPLRELEKRRNGGRHRRTLQGKEERADHARLSAAAQSTLTSCNSQQLPTTDTWSV